MNKEKYIEISEDQALSDFANDYPDVAYDDVNTNYLGNGNFQTTINVGGNELTYNNHYE